MSVKNFDYGPVFQVLDTMKSKVFVCVLVVERILGRMIHGVQAYTAYGFDDDKFKYGLSGKWMVDKKNESFCL
jgi:hypothetical protein